MTLHTSPGASIDPAGLPLRSRFDGLIDIALPLA